MEILQVSSVAYFRLSEIFVNERDCGWRQDRILLTRKTLAAESTRRDHWYAGFGRSAVEKLRMSVEKSRWI